MMPLVEAYADLSQYAIPIVAGAIQLVEERYTSAGAFFIAGMIHQFIIPHVKRFFPNAVRPNGSPGSFPSTHTSAVCMGAVFLLLREGLTTRSAALVNLAALTAFSRWWTNHHWPVDLLGGATMGSLLAFATDSILRLNDC